MTEILKRIKVKSSEFGYVKVADGTIIVLRGVVVDVRPFKGTLISPFFIISATLGTAAYASEEAINEVKDKPTIQSIENIKEGWKRIEIVENEKKNAFEEVVYESDGKKYLIRAEMEPTMVFKKSNYKTPDNTPLYHVVWTLRADWKEMGE